ncbi:MAG: 3-hydroxyacyl-CoA dehydrogenase family protein [Clostridiales Family XIII bacterium]|jgi:carnitine 3-dehydrogenase|nr:3-hydroxyacyl-CoA dehydrogenase family protein [Clostridiales Family XIII bacterium]
MNEKKIAFIGSGLIGTGLAVNALTHGYSVTLQTRRRVDKMKERVAHILDLLAETRVCTKEETEAAAARATYTTSVAEAADGAAFIQESGPENLETKKAMYAEIERACPSGALIASSTSKLLPTDLQSDMTRPERLLVGHPYHPSYLLPLVELCGGRHTAPETVATAKAFYESFGKRVIVCRKELSGYIVNRLNWAAMDEARRTVLDGCCTVEEMDQAIMYGPGLRMALTGQILTISLGVEGGLRGMTAKYGDAPSGDDETIAAGVEAEMQNRSPLTGRTEAEISDFRDRAIITLLRLQGLL